MVHRRSDLAIVPGERAIDEIVPRVLFDADDFIASFKAASVNRAKLWVLLKAEQVPITPQRELVLEMRNVLGRRRRVALAHRVFGVTHLNELLVCGGKLRIAGQRGGGLHE